MCRGLRDGIRQRCLEIIVVRKYIDVVVEQVKYIICLLGRELREGFSTTEKLEEKKQHEAEVKEIIRKAEEKMKKHKKIPDSKKIVEFTFLQKAALEIAEHMSMNIKTERKEDDLWGTPLQIINELKTVEQSPKYHPEGNVYNHVMLVVDKAAQIRNLANSKKEFMLAALLHDVGKKEATKKNSKGNYTSYNHDKIGEKIVNDILTNYDINNIEREKIVNLVKYHMHHLYILKNLPYGNIEEMIKNVDLNDMILLFISDRLGRGQKCKDDIEKELYDVKTIIEILKKKFNSDIDVFEKAYNLIIK